MAEEELETLRAAGRISREPPKCGICDIPESRHEGLHHQFMPEGVDRLVLRSDKSQRAIAARRVPFDPIVRLLLIRKGVITAEELQQAEAELNATGILGVNQGPLR